MSKTIARPMPAKKIEQEWAADLLNESKKLNPNDSELHKKFKQERIKLLGLTLIEGGNMSKGLPKRACLSLIKGGKQE